MYRIVAVSIAVALTAGCASGGPRVETSPLLETYMNYAAPPVSSFSMLGGIDSWTPVDSEHVVLHTRNRKAYLIRVFGACPDLRIAHGIAVESAMSSSVHRMDKIIVGEDTCPISEIRPIAIEQFKADRAAARERATPD